MTREELEQKLVVLMAGRAAEQLVFEELSTGTADDLAKATDIARSMVTRYGMDKDLGHATYEEERPSLLGMPYMGESQNFSEDTAKQIDESVREIINGAFERALSKLTEYQTTLQAGAQKLLLQETLDEDDLAELKAALPGADSGASEHVVALTQSADQEKPESIN